MDDTGVNDDSDLDDDSDYTLPFNIDLFGLVSWSVGGWPHVPSFNFGAVGRFSQDQWNPSALWINCILSDIWGSSPNDVYAVGEENFWDWQSYSNSTSRFLAHYNGVRWTVTRDPGQAWTFNGIYGTSVVNVYMVGNANPGGYAIYHFDGLVWVIENTGLPATSSYLKPIWASPSGLVAAGGSNLNGYLFVTKEVGTWQETNFASDGNFTSINTLWGSPEDVIFAAGSWYNMDPYETGCTIFQYREGAWALINESGMENTCLTKIAGTSSTDVYATGHLNDQNDSEGLWHYDGTSWTEVSSQFCYPNERLSDLWVADHDSVFVVSQVISYITEGRLLYYDGHSWHTLSEATGAYALWGFVNP
jgi:hypothetical protein